MPLTDVHDVQQLRRVCILLRAYGQARIVLQPLLSNELYEATAPAPTVPAVAGTSYAQVIAAAAGSDWLPAGLLLRLDALTALHLSLAACRAAHARGKAA